MAIAAVAAIPALQNMDPNQALEFIEAAERVAARARSISWQLIHSSELTAEEQYKGWIPLMLIMYRLWQTFLEPQVAFTLQTQIGIAQVMNRFGANIDTSQMQTLLSKVQDSVHFFKDKINPPKPQPQPSAPGVILHGPGGSLIGGVPVTQKTGTVDPTKPWEVTA